MNPYFREEEVTEVDRIQYVPGGEIITKTITERDYNQPQMMNQPYGMQ